MPTCGGAVNVWAVVSEKMMSCCRDLCRRNYSYVLTPIPLLCPNNSRYGLFCGPVGYHTMLTGREQLRGPMKLAHESRRAVELIENRFCEKCKRYLFYSIEGPAQDGHCGLFVSSRRKINHCVNYYIIMHIMILFRKFHNMRINF